jgi:hypothetical protein
MIVQCNFRDLLFGGCCDLPSRILLIFGGFWEWPEDWWNTLTQAQIELHGGAASARRPFAQLAVRR